MTPDPANAPGRERRGAEPSAGRASRSPRKRSRPAPPAGLWDRLSRKVRWAFGRNLDPIFEEQFNRLRHSVLNHPTVQSPRSILVTSAIAAEGKTTVAAGLARAFARSHDHHALLVEADLRHPSLSQHFDLPPGPGLVDHILDGVPIADVICETDIPKLSLIRAGTRASAPANVIASAQMRTFTKEVTERYPDRIVVYDASPVVPTPEPLSLSLLVDGIVLVVHSRRASRAVVRQSLKNLPQEKILGTVLNCTPFATGEWSYYSGYYYDPEAAAAGAEEPAQ
jgi:capsular exopolysaccharide synthesis family protein